MSKNETTEETYELPYTLKLKHAVQVGKETTLSELTFVDIPDAAAMEMMPVGDTKIGDFYPAIASMTKTPASHIRKIKWSDMQKIMPIVTYFLAE